MKIILSGSLLLFAAGFILFLKVNSKENLPKSGAPSLGNEEKHQSPKSRATQRDRKKTEARESISGESVPPFMAAIGKMIAERDFAGLTKFRTKANETYIVSKVVGLLVEEQHMRGIPPPSDRIEGLGKELKLKVLAHYSIGRGRPESRQELEEWVIAFKNLEGKKEVERVTFSFAFQNGEQSQAYLNSIEKLDDSFVTGLLGGLMTEASDVDPKAILDSIPKTKDYGKHLKSSLPKWFVKDSKAAGEWVSNLEEGEYKIIAVREMIKWLKRKQYDDQAQEWENYIDSARVESR